MFDITEKYLNKYAVEPSNPTEIALNGYEKFGNGAIGIDDPDGTSLEVLYTDLYDDIVDAEPGTDKRTTFVRAKQAGETLGSIGWQFPGLIKLNDLRTWYRTTNNITDPQQENTGNENNG